MPEYLRDRFVALFYHELNETPGLLNVLGAGELYAKVSNSVSNILYIEYGAKCLTNVYSFYRSTLLVPDHDRAIDAL